MPMKPKSQAIYSNRPQTGKSKVKPFKSQTMKPRCSHHHAGILNSHAVSFVSFVLSASICISGVAIASAANRNWTGAVNANWSEPNNWSPAGIPQSGDDLSFGFVDDSHRSMVNDVTALSVDVMFFANNDYQI